MALKINNLKITEPDYFHREYKNDLPQAETENYYLKQGKRMTTVALPFLALYRPLGFPLSLTLGGLRSFSSISQLITDVQNGGIHAGSYAFLQVVFSIIALCGTVFAHPLGMLMTTVHDCALDCFSLGTHLFAGEFQSALGNSANLINNTLYLALFLHGSLEIAIASLAMQILIGLSQSAAEFRKGNYLEAGGHLLMGGIRGHQLIGQVQILQVKQKIEIVLKKAKVGVKAQEHAHQVDKNIAMKAKSPAAVLPEKQDLVDILTKYDHNPLGIPALQYAILENDHFAIDALLEHGASPHTLDAQGRNCLHYAVKSGSLDLVKKFISLGIVPQELDLYVAISENKNKIAKHLISLGQLNFNLVIDGSNGLSYCLDRGNLTMLKFLLSKGGQFVSDEDWLRLLSHSGYTDKKIFAQKVKCLKFLEKKNMLTNSKDHYTYIPVIADICPEGLKYILDHEFISPDQSYFIHPDPDLQFTDHSTVYPEHILTFAMQNEIYKFELVRMLLEKGASINNVAGWHWPNSNVFHFISRQPSHKKEELDREKELINLLVEAGASLKTWGESPVDYVKDPDLRDYMISLGIGCMETS